MHIAIMVVAATVFVLTVLVAKALEQSSVTEMRRQARAGKDVELYKLKATGRHGDWLLVLLGGVSIIVFLSQLSDLIFWTAFVVAGAFIICPFSVSRKNYLWQVANKVAGWYAQFLAHLPVSPQGTHRLPHTKLYEKEDLLELVERQSRQPDSRINEHELKLVTAALTFSTKRVRDAMVPLAKAKRVAETEDIGPHLLDELHKTGAESFIVVKDSAKTAKFVPTGTLYLDDALTHAQGGKVRDAMKADIEYIDEDLPLIDALEEFITKRRHIFIVQNNFEEVVGSLSMQNVLEQIFGASSRDEPKNDKLTTDDKQSPGKPSR